MFSTQVARNLAALHGVLAKQLPVEQLQEVCTNIFELLNTKLPALYAAVKPATDAGRTRVVADLTFLVSAVSRLPGVDAANLRLDPLAATFALAGGGGPGDP